MVRRLVVRASLQIISNNLLFLSSCLCRLFYTLIYDQLQLANFDLTKKKKREFCLLPSLKGNHPVCLFIGRPSREPQHNKKIIDIPKLSANGYSRRCNLARAQIMYCGQKCHFTVHGNFDLLTLAGANRNHFLRLEEKLTSLAYLLLTTT